MCALQSAVAMTTERWHDVAVEQDADDAGTDQESITCDDEPHPAELHAARVTNL